MSENNMAVIQFLGYRLVNIHYNCAPEFEFPEEDLSDQAGIPGHKTHVSIPHRKRQDFRHRNLRAMIRIRP